MQLRQSGGVLSEVLDIAKNDAGEPDPMLSAIVMAAFDEPRFNTDSNRAQAVVDFRNDIELACFKQQAPQ